MTYRNADKGGTSHVHRKQAQKFGEDRTCRSGDMLADRQTNRQTNTQTDTLVTILRQPTEVKA